MRYQQSQRSKLRAHFRGHVYYKLCQRTREVFLQHCPTIILSTEELFADAARILDDLLTEGDFDTERCVDLWTDSMADYRRKDGTDADAATTQAEVAMLFYAVMFGLQSVRHSHYRGRLQRVLHTSIHRMWNREGQRNCDGIERQMPEAVDHLTGDMCGWMDAYFSSAESLTDEIDDILNPDKAGQTARTGLPLPMVLDTQKAQMYFQKAIDMGWMSLEGNRFRWQGIGNSAHNSQLAYFCGRVYGYEYSVQGNIGTEFPKAELEETFGVKNLYSSLCQVYTAQKKQKWRSCVDELFE